MAEITIQGDHLHVELAWWEKLLGILRSIDVPLAQVTGAEVLADPITEVHGFKVGMGLPSRKVGTWKSAHRTTLAAVQRGRPGLKITLDGHRFSDLVVSQPGAESLVAAIRGNAGGARSTGTPFG